MINYIKFNYIIGIDCGASSSEAVITPMIQMADYKEFRKKLVSAKKKNSKRITWNTEGGWMPQKYPPVNFNVLGFEKTAERLIIIIKDISKKAGLKNVYYVTAGISGARNENDRKKLESYIKTRTKIKNVNILPDTEIAFAAAFRPGENNCGILIAGTGSILYYRDSKGKINSVGGWGRLIGDEGSGLWIARQALSIITKNFDNRGKKTLLTSFINERFGLNGDTIISRIYHDGFAAAKIAKLVFRAAEKGDLQSRKIIKDAANELALHFLPLKNKNYSIALTGSLFSEEKLLEREFKKIIKSKFPKITLIKPNIKPVWGAVKIANLKLGNSN